MTLLLLAQTSVARCR